MIEIAPVKWGYFDQIIVMQIKQPFSFSRVTLILLQTLGKFESDLLVTIWASFLLVLPTLGKRRITVNFETLAFVVNSIISNIFYSKIYTTL